MKQTIYLILVMLLLIGAHQQAEAQELPFMWSNSFGSSDFDKGSGISTDVSGNIITVGQFKGTVDFDPGAGTTSFNSSGSGGYVQKLDGAGDLVWVKEFLPTSSTRHVLPKAVVTDNSGNIYVVGHFSAQADFEPGAGTNILNAVGYDGFVMKLNSSGDVLWVDQFESSSNVNLNDLVLDASSNIYVIGRHQGTIDLDPGAGTSSATAASGKYRLLLIKLDSNGDFISGYSTMESTNMDAYDIELDSNGDIFIAGHYFSSISVQFAGASALNTSSVSVGGFVVSVNATTEERSSFLPFDGSGSDYATSISFNSSGEMFVGGYFDGDIDLNPSTGNWDYTSNGGDDVFIARFTSFGTFSRGTRIGGSSDDQLIKIIADTDVVHAIGTFQGTVDFDPYTGTTNKTAAATDGFVWTVNSLTTTFTLNRIQIFGSTGNVVMSDFLRSGDSDIITGGFYGTLDADPTASTNSHSASGSSADVFQIRLGDNDSPTDIQLSSTNVNENAAVNTTVGNLTTTDADGGDTHIYSLVSGTGDTDNASFNISGSSLRIGISPNHEAKDTYSVRIQTSDGNGGNYAEAFTISINDLNDLPTNITMSSTDVDENTGVNTTVGSLTTTDEDDGDTHTYFLVSGTGDTDNGSFNISGSSLRIGISPNHETKDTYSVRIQTNDGNGGTYSEAFTISINDVNEAPTKIVISPSDIDENTGSNATVGSILVTDVDDGDTHSLALVSGKGDTHNGSFFVNRGNLILKNGVSHESFDELYILIEATDGGGLSHTQAIVIIINDVPEAPTNITLNNSSIDENEAAGTVVGTFTTTDQDVGETYTYTFATSTGDTDNGSFMIDGTSLKSASVFDYEIKDSYSVLINTNDGNGGNFNKAFTITVNDIAEFITWSGTAWSNGSGPNAGGDDVIIDGDYNMGTDGYFDSRDLTINSGVTMTVDGESNLAVQRNLINNGAIIVESGSSLMVNSPNTITGNDITFRRNTRYADGRYSFVGSPVEQDASIIGSDLGNHVYKYNEATAYGADGINRWEDASADELVPGKGYTQADQQVIEFVGMPNQGTITIDGTFNEVGNDGHEGWVLVSNPYPAAIDVADFLSANTNTTGSIYIWDDNGSNSQRGTNSDYIVANGTMATNTTPAGGQTRYDQTMGSMQGFFVKLTSAADVEVEFREDMRVTGNSDDHFFRSNPLPIARVNLTSSDGLFKQTVIGLAEDATNNKINRIYDGQPFSATSDNGIYTMKAGRSLALNGMTSNWEVIQLQLNTSESGIYEISVELEDYNQSIFIKDNQTGDVVDLRNESYTFSANAGIDMDRFQLLSSPQNILGVNKNEVLVYAHNSVLYIQPSDNSEREYLLFDMNGKQLLTTSTDEQTEVNLNTYPSGIYLVFDGQKTHKIILK